MGEGGMTVNDLVLQKPICENIDTIFKNYLDIIQTDLDTIQ